MANPTLALYIERANVAKTKEMEKTRIKNQIKSNSAFWNQVKSKCL